MLAPINFFLNKVWWFSFALIIAFNVYWGWIATDRYVSTSHIVIQTPDVAPPELSFSSMLSGVASNNTADLLLLREYLLSPDILRQLDQEFDLRTHFSQEYIDYLSRLSDANVPMEKFYDYFQNRISVNLDDYSGVLIVEAQLYNPELAQKLVQYMISLGEIHMNQMGQRLATEQVKFIEKQVNQLATRLSEATQAVLNYQNSEGMLSPSETAASISSLIAQLNVELVKLKAQRSAQSSYLSPKSSDMIRLKNEIRSLQQQIDVEQAKLTAMGGNALNQASSEYDELQLKAKFAQELYANALATLEATRVEAARKLKQVSVISEPNKPEYSVEPKRLYLMTVFTLVIFFLTLILFMIIAIVKDHRD